MKKIALTVLVLSFAFLSSSKAFAGGAYGIDSIIDNNTGDNWLDSTPTLQRGSTYNVTVHGGFAGLFTYPEDPAELGLYADFDGTRSPSQWSTFLGAPVIQGTDSPDVLAFGPLVFAEYGLTGNFLVPNDAAAVGSFFAYIRPGSAGATSILDGNLAKNFFDANFTGSSVVANPEPATLSLIGLGLGAALLVRRKKQAA